MKHVFSVSKSISRGDVFQDVICSVAGVIAGVVEAKGGSSPVVSYIDSKCAIPVDPTE